MRTYFLKETTAEYGNPLTRMRPADNSGLNTFLLIALTKLSLGLVLSRGTAAHYIITVVSIRLLPFVLYTLDSPPQFEV